MKIYINTDLEGIGGILTTEQTHPDKTNPEYQKARFLLTKEINAAVEGAVLGGAKEIVVLDGHANSYNIIPEGLDPRATYITGVSRKEGLMDLDGSFDAMFLLGFHAMAGTEKALLEHSYSSLTWFCYYLNGMKVGEIGHESAIAGHFNVPVVFISGDKAACEEAKTLLGDIETVVVKEAFTRHCARMIPPIKSRELIKEGVQRALKRIKDFKPYIIKPPIEAKVVLQRNDYADSHEKMGWKRIDARTVTKTVNSILDIL